MLADVVLTSLLFLVLTIYSVGDIHVELALRYAAVSIRAQLSILVRMLWWGQIFVLPVYRNFCRFVFNQIYSYME